MLQRREEHSGTRRDASSEQLRLAATTPRIVIRAGTQGEVPPLSEIPRPTGIRWGRQSAPGSSSGEPRFTETRWVAPGGLPILTDAQRSTATLADARLELQRKAAEARHTEALPDALVEQRDEK